MKRLKHVTTHNDDVLDETTRPDTEILYVDISSVDGLSGIKSKELLQFSTAPSRARRRVRHGDVIVSTVRTYLRAIAGIRHPEENLIVSTGFAVVRPGAELASDFLSYLLSASFFVEQVIARSTGVSYPAINATDLVGIPAPIPPLPEQTQIAQFLDYETAKIDRLIEKQEALIRLLKEKRQAVISHAVTKGLNPHAPLKDSGIPWLGQVPTHWAIKPLATVAAFSPGKAHEPFIDDDGKYVCVNSRFVSTGGESRKFCTHNITPAAPNDVLMVMSDLPNGRALAKAYFVTDEKDLAINQRVCAITAIDGVPRFLYYFLDRNAGFLLHDDGVNQTHLSNADFTKLPTLVLPKEEQHSIADFLDQTTRKINELISKAELAVEVMQERRTALISTAVTGKIDVRHWRPPVGPAPDAAEIDLPQLSNTT